MMKIKNVNFEIACTHIVSRKRQTLVAASGVMIGIGIFLFMNSLSSGFTRYSRGEIFKNSAHIKIYKEQNLCEPLLSNTDSVIQVLVNPQIVAESKTIINPQRIISSVKEFPFITFAIAQVNSDVFYNVGKAQLRGTVHGVNIKESNDMFNIKSYMVAGDLFEIQYNLDAIVIGKGIAEKLNVRIHDNISITSSEGVVRLMKVKGIFSTGNAMSDQSKSYVNINTAQQLLKESRSYVTTIYANTINPDNALEYAERLQSRIDYKVEPWQVTNSDMLSGDKVRNTLMGSISFSILIVAAFGIYNILNMTVMQKMNDIAILKATGFSGKDVIQIFVMEALIMGLIGCLAGLIMGALLITILKSLYMGPPLGYFPIYFDAYIFGYSFLLGALVTFGAGYLPARKAANVDPIEIFRK